MSKLIDLGMASEVTKLSATSGFPEINASGSPCNTPVTSSASPAPNLC